jgi:hypothetical protein
VKQKPLPLPLVAPLPLQNLHVEMTSNALSRRYQLTVHRAIDGKKSGNFLTALRTYIRKYSQDMSIHIIT